MPNYHRPNHDDQTTWCIVIDGEECEPGTAQCPECGLMPDADEPHEWEPGGTWTCSGCGDERPVVPYSEET